MLTGNVGHYRIVRPLGSGGMGEVYLVEDPKLGRQVALKIVTGELAVNRDQRDRFEREARAVAALNHPNIVTLHSIEDWNGTPFLTMEYVEGQALAEVIPASGMPLERLLKLAIPLSDAVGTAHQRGILHRDLKPGNVMVTPDGRVKVLDFGLAKLQDNGASIDALPTQELTGEGRIVGTISYMSPEQAEGKPVDSRSDVFSLGVVLYVMATGQRPFQGDSSLSVLSAILRETPKPVTERRPDLPRDFGRLVKRALSKDPDQRYQSAKDLRNDLQTLLEDLSSGELASATPAIASTTPVARFKGWPLLAGTGLVAALGAIAFSLYSNKPAPSASPPTEVWTPVRLTATGRVGNVTAISPDGRYVAYPLKTAAGVGLSVRQVATNAEAQLLAPGDVLIDGLAFSRDSNFVYYSAYPVGDNAGTLFRVPVLGGVPQKLIANIDTSATFSPDGKQLAYIVNFPEKASSQLLVAQSDGGAPKIVAERRRPDSFSSSLGARPAWSPDGSQIAAPAFEGALQGVVLVDATTGAMRPAGERRWARISAMEWLPDAQTLIVAADDGSTTFQLWRLHVKTGAVERVTNDLHNYIDVGLSADGRSMVALSIDRRSTVWTAVATDLTAMVEITTAGGDREGAAGLAWAADGHLLFSSVSSGNPDLWSLDPATRVRRPLTTDPAADIEPIGSPDGRSVAFVSQRGGSQRIWVMDADGSNPRPVSAGPDDQFPVWTPDSSSLVYSRPSAKRFAMIARLADGNEQALDVRAGGEAGTALPADFVPRAISWQGWLAGLSQVDPARGGGWRVSVVPLGGGTLRTLDVTTNSSAAPMAWAPDGTAIDLIRPGSPDLWRYPVDGRPGRRLITSSGSVITRRFAWSLDGTRLALARGEDTADVVLFKQTER